RTRSASGRRTTATGTGRCRETGSSRTPRPDIRSRRSTDGARTPSPGRGACTRARTSACRAVSRSTRRRTEGWSPAASREATATGSSCRTGSRTAPASRRPTTTTRGTSCARGRASARATPSPWRARRVRRRVATCTSRSWLTGRTSTRWTGSPDPTGVLVSPSGSDGGSSPPRAAAPAVDWIVRSGDRSSRTRMTGPCVSPVSREEGLVPKDTGRKSIARNRKALHEYHIEDTYEAGLVLTGTEVKSLREGRANLTDGVALIFQGEAWLEHVFIPEYAAGQGKECGAARRRRLV